MHLRASEEAEMRGLDLDQFFDEAIGESDWATYAREEMITLGTPEQHAAADSEASSDASMDRDAVAEAKTD